MKKITLLSLLLVFSIGFCNAQELPIVKMQTGLGDIRIEVDTLNAPLTGKNFLQHINNYTYRNAKFYRVVRLDNQPQNDVKIEVIQGGVFTEIRFGKVEPIPHETTEESGLKHLDGTISMARMEPGSATTEFFICINDQPELDYGAERNPDKQGFAAFGKVIEGMDVVRKIQGQEDEQQNLVEAVPITKISIE